MLIKDFQEFIDFPQPLEGVVYVLFFATSSSGKPIPFYVGQTSRFLWSRMVEYLLADFQAATDFKVGEAIRYLTQTKGMKVLMSQRQSTDRLADEKSVIKELLLAGVPLLNGFSGYNYQSANPGEQRGRIQKRCDEILSHVSKTQMDA